MIVAYASWGILPAYWKLLHAISPTELLAQRIIWSAIFLGVLLFGSSQLSSSIRILKNPRLAGSLIISALLIALNWYTYIWAINNNLLLETSLGYFICPLTSVLLGFLFLRERLRTVQAAAIFIVTLGVAIRVLLLGQFPWIALLLALSFSAYSLLRKQAHVEALPGLFIETFLLSVPALLGLALINSTSSAHLIDGSITNFLWAISCGVVTALPLLWLISGARYVSMTFVGMAQYISPTLNFLLAAFVYKEDITLADMVSFPVIWAGLGIFLAEALYNWGKMSGRLNNQEPLAAVQQL